MDDRAHFLSVRAGCVAGLTVYFSPADAADHSRLCRVTAPPAITGGQPAVPG